MSHEGIRFVSEQQARREEQNSEQMPADAVTPAKIRVKKSEGTGVEIDWKDGHRSAWGFTWLRNACPCATCHEEREQSGRLPGLPKAKENNPLALYEAPPKPVEVTPVGRYAIKFKWSDGHESGIYSWDYLRRMCLCDACITKRELHENR